LTKDTPKPSFIVRYRPKIGALLFLLALPIILVGSRTFPEATWQSFILSTLGYALIIAGVFGRLWSMLYIGGRKDKELQRVGPYSVVRHPLYVSSLMLGLGLSALSQNLLVLIIVLVYFILQYRTTIKHEEAVLSGLFGETYANYKRVTPCFIPRFSHLDTTPPESINLRPLSREFSHGLAALALIPLFRLIALLHEGRILPTLLKFP
jgi:protein-S-isoprenylcysteine O-methyltransferase Ste14